MVVLSKAVNVGRDHLIHRYAVPLPLRGEGLSAVEIEAPASGRAARGNASLAASWKCRDGHSQSRFNLSGVKAFPYEGKGDHVSGG